MILHTSRHWFDLLFRRNPFCAHIYPLWLIVYIIMHIKRTVVIIITVLLRRILGNVTRSRNVSLLSIMRQVHQNATTCRIYSISNRGIEPKVDAIFSAEFTGSDLFLSFNLHSSRPRPQLSLNIRITVKRFITSWLQYDARGPVAGCFTSGVHCLPYLFFFSSFESHSKKKNTLKHYFSVVQFKQKTGRNSLLIYRDSFD